MKRFLSASVLVAMVFSGACGDSSLAPSPNDSDGGPHSQLSWDFWLGNPRCISGSCLLPPPQRLGGGTEGTHSFNVGVNTIYQLYIHVNYPRIAGRTIKTIVSDEVSWQAEQTGKPDIRTHESITENRPYRLEIDAGGGPSRRQPGMYSINIIVEETGPGLSQPVILKTIIWVILV